MTNMEGKEDKNGKLNLEITHLQIMKMFLALTLAELFFSVI